MVFQNDILAGSSGASGTSTAVHTIDQSIRFNKDDSAYLSKTFGASASNRRTHTYSFWVKLGGNASGTNASGGCFFISTDDTGANAGDYFHLNDSLELRYWSNNSSAETFKTNQVFRDFSAWYHIVLVNDRDNSVGTEAVRLYVNGQRVTSFAVNNISGRSGQDTMVNASSFYWQIQRFTSSTVHGDAYMAEIVFIDGQALDPSSFGLYNDSNIWIPKDVSGLTFGTNGFHIKGESASDLGNDSSSNNNDFTTSGLTSDDQKSDSPTNNHATWNPITSTAQTYSNGNLKASSSSNAWKGGFTTAQVPLNSGTWYYEIYVDLAGSSGGQFSIGWSESNRSVSDDNSSGDTEGWVTYALNGNYYSNGGNGSYGATYTTGNVIGCKIDTNSSTNNVEFYKDGASQGTISQAFNTGGTSFISPYILLYATRNATARFAQSEWTQTPSGITDANAINTKNLGS